MSMPECRGLAAAAAVSALAFTAGCTTATATATAFAAGPQGPRLGRVVPADEAARASLNVFPDGRGLPPGRGRAAEGEPLFRQHCAVCHGAGGRGASAEELGGGSEPLTSEYPDKTIGLYWPYATTLFDITRRSMPMTAPGSLSSDQVYAITAYLLAINGVIGERDEISDTSLPKVRMPNRDGFIGIDARWPR